ncbi:hypothetical protein SAMN03080615_01333 [Amphritea atlantica]|uniref:DUF5610 domain-containing protein n=1 Tax=Amphritea atlantica TaxID=355243 RepID=A0A1H9FLX7_9GAMM|nr:DUF5610 domain-containing protein [Amphritea atlantica]SEQ38980.1 hypothetical protein SAMN03080615_01333 [Amphritea atlantica]
MEISSIQGQSAAERNKPTEETAATQKSVQNQAILQASLDVSISSGNDSLALLYRTAVTELNKVLEADLGPSAIQQAYDSGVDVSPAATAERIVALSANFFSSYQDQHPEMDYQTQVKSFVKLISGGIDQGFADAREILDGLQVLQGDIAANIDTTYDLVQEKLSTLMDTLLNPDPAAADDAEQPG